MNYHVTLNNSDYNFDWVEAEFVLESKYWATSLAGRLQDPFHFLRFTDEFWELPRDWQTKVPVAGLNAWEIINDVHFR